LIDNVYKNILQTLDYSVDSLKGQTSLLNWWEVIYTLKTHLVWGKVNETNNYLHCGRIRNW
jgi:hypothetical protein